VRWRKALVCYKEGGVVLLICCLALGGRSRLDAGGTFWQGDVKDGKAGE
jgi:hypothetical protein